MSPHRRRLAPLLAIRTEHAVPGEMRPGKLRRVIQHRVCPAGEGEVGIVRENSRRCVPGRGILLPHSGSRQNSVARGDYDIGREQVAHDHVAIFRKPVPLFVGKPIRRRLLVGVGRLHGSTHLSGSGQPGCRAVTSATFTAFYLFLRATRRGCEWAGGSTSGGHQCLSAVVEQRGAYQMTVE